MTAGSSQLPGLTWCRVAVQNAAKQQPNSFFPLEREKQIPAGLRRGISWGEAQEHHEGTNSASPVALCLPMGWVTRLCAQQDCCCHGAGYFPQRGWGGGLGFGVSGWMLRMLDSQLPPPPGCCFWSVFPPVFTHSSRAQLLSHTWLLEGQETFPLPAPPHKERLIKTTPGRKSTGHPHLQGTLVNGAPTSPWHP